MENVSLKKMITYVSLGIALIIGIVVYWKFFGSGSYRPVLREYAQCYKNHDYENLVKLYPEEMREDVLETYESYDGWKIANGMYENISSVKLVSVDEVSSLVWADNYVQESSYGHFNIQASEKYEATFIVKGTYDNGKAFEDEETVAVAKVKGKWYLVE